jgi:NTP pyrophosphatase (non-canonical NTP hydrolase)
MISTINDIEELATHYGYDCQSRQLIEEMAELTQAINKLWRKELYFGNHPLVCVLDDIKDTDNYKNIVEEIGDVEIMLEQVKYLLDCRERVEESKDYKIMRELRRISRKEDA